MGMDLPVIVSGIGSFRNDYCSDNATGKIIVLKAF